MQEKTSTDHLLTAIYNRDVQGAKQALLDGADVNQNATYSSDPIWLHSIWMADYATGEDKERLTKIWEMIVTRATNASASDSISSHIGLSGRIFNLQNSDAASLIVMAAIKETKGNAQINLPEMFSRYGDAKDPYDHARQHLKQQVLSTHNQVSERLSIPTTSFEKAVAASLSDTWKKYWLEPLAFPDLADLPVPTQQFCDAVEQVIQASRESGQLMRPYVSQGRAQPMPEGVRLANQMALDEAGDAIKEIGELSEQGRLGIRLPKPRNLTRTTHPSADTTSSFAQKTGSSAGALRATEAHIGLSIPPKDQAKALKDASDRAVKHDQLKGAIEEAAKHTKPPTQSTDANTERTAKLPRWTAKLRQIGRKGHGL